MLSTLRATNNAYIRSYDLLFSNSATINSIPTPHQAGTFIFLSLLLSCGMFWQAITIMIRSCTIPTLRKTGPSHSMHFTQLKAFSAILMKLSGNKKGRSGWRRSRRISGSDKGAWSFFDPSMNNATVDANFSRGTVVVASIFLRRQEIWATESCWGRISCGKRRAARSCKLSCVLMFWSLRMKERSRFTGWWARLFSQKNLNSEDSSHVAASI